MLCTPKAAVSRRLGFPIVIAISAQPLTLTRIRWPEATLGAHFATFARESHLAGFCALYMSQSLYIIDAFSQIFRAYWSPAARRRSVRGKPVGAAFIFARMCLALIQKQKPDFIVAAFDSKEKTFRDDIYPQYKAEREAMPEDLAEQLPLVRSILEAMGIPILEVPGLEADDIIGVLSKLGEKKGYEVRLVSRDKDLKQLLSEHVKLLNEEDGSTYGPEELKAEFGLRPEQFLEVLALAGDSVDNIPGAKGVGVKTAAKLLAEHGSLEKIFTAAESGAIKQPKLRENLIAFKPESKLSRQLAAIVTDGEWAAKVPFDESAAKVHDLEERKAKLLPLLVDLNFNSIVEDLGWKAEAIASSPESGVRSPESKSTNAAPKAETGAPKGVQKSMFGSAPAKPSAPPPPKELVEAQAKYATIDTPDDFKKLIDRLKKTKTFALHCLADEPAPLEESDDEEEDKPRAASSEPRTATLVGIAFAFEPGEACYLPLNAAIKPAAAFDALKPVLESAKINKRGHDLKRDMRLLLAQGIDMAGAESDTKLDAFMLDTVREDARLDSLSREYLGLDIPGVETIAGGEKRRPGKLADADAKRVSAYGAMCADYALRVSRILEPQLKAQDLVKLTHELELPLVQVLAHMETRGIKIDQAYLAKLGKEMAERIGELEREIHKLAGQEFTVNSPKQLGAILFDKLNLPVQGKTAKGTGRSTDMGTLEKLAPLHPLPAKVVEYRHQAKLKSTYVDALPLLADEKGRVHTSYRQTVATGRLSSKDPNVQNIPVRTELGQKIRRAFIAEKGHKLISADYSQIELRLLAHVSDDPHLKQAFHDGEDIHKAVAAKVFGIALKDVTKEQRNTAKTVNYAVLYGQSAFGLSQLLNVSRAEATQFIENYFSGYPNVKELQTKVLEGCRKDGYVTTLLGRKRYLPEITSKNAMLRSQAERQAFNTVLQGTAADLIKKAMLNVHAAVEAKKLPYAMLLQVHDELVFEAPEKEAKKCAEFAKEKMSGAMKLSVPLVVDVGIGDNWLEAK